MEAPIPVRVAPRPPRPRPPRRNPRGRGGRAWFLAALPLTLAAACGDDSMRTTTKTTRMRPDAAPYDAGPLPPLPSADVDAAPLIDGSPPDALADDPCAIDTNKVFELVRSFDAPESSQLAVDLAASRFGVAYVDRASQSCGDALYVAELEGPSGAPPPEISVAIEECTDIRHPAITRTEERWLFAFVDNRLPGLDVWAQAFDPRDEKEQPHQRITESVFAKSDIELASLGPDGAIVAWVETTQDPDFQENAALKVRALYPDGLPYLPEVVLDAAPARPSDCPPADPAAATAACERWLDRWSFHEPRLARIGASNAAIVYRRDGRKGSQIVLQILDIDANPLRDPWVLTTDASPDASANLATDEEGGAVIYSSGPGNAILLQRLNADGEAAPAMSGTLVTGPSTPVEIVGAPFFGVDASVAKLPTGFAVAYRALPGADSNGDGVPDVDTGIDSPRIRILFLDRVGTTLRDSSIAFAEAIGGRTSIAAAYDGRVVAAWTDAHDDASVSLTAVRLPCVGGP